jgi:hypothetical protein
LSESVQQRWLQSDLADGTCKRVRRNLLNPATSARLPDMSRPSETDTKSSLETLLQFEFNKINITI